MTESRSTPAGWYPDVNTGQERYWDGSAWTEHLRGSQLTETQLPIAAPAADQPPKSKSGKGWIIGGSIAAGVILIGVVGGAIGGASDEESPAAIATAETVDAVAAAEVPFTEGLTAKEAKVLIENAGLKTSFSADEGVVLDQDNWTVLSTTPAAGEAMTSGQTVVINVTKTIKATPAEAAPAEPVAPVAPAAPAVPQYSLPQQQAIKTAQSYLDYSGFSRSGLVGQLEYEGFSTDDASFGADNAGADWNAEAAESAKSYLDYSAFSREGLYDQLIYEGFQPSEVEFGLAAVGY